MGASLTTKAARARRRLAPAVLVALSLFSPLVAGAQSDCTLWPLPLAEAEWVLTKWLAAGGFDVTRDTPEPGTTRLRAEKGAERRGVLLEPRSPLATCVRLAGVPDAARARELSDLLDRYLGGAAPIPILRDDEVPGPVLLRRAASVCLEAEEREGVVRSSGFVLEPTRRVLTTAHDLEGAGRVTAIWEDGRRSTGRLLRADSRTDLALVELEHPAPGGVSLAGARGVLADGEEVFAIGCPSGTGETIRSGRVRLPMAVVGALRLWAVEMETLPGGSGSPVFDAAGNLAGVVKGRIRGTDAAGLLIPVEAVLRFLEGSDAGAPAPSSKGGRR